MTEAAIYFRPTTILFGSIHEKTELFREVEGEGYVCRLTAQQILSATAKSKLLNKRIVMRIRNLDDLEQEAIIDNGVLSVKSIVKAISKLTKVDGTV